MIWIFGHVAKNLTWNSLTPLVTDMVQTKKNNTENLEISKIGDLEKIDNLEISKSKAPSSKGKGAEPPIPGTLRSHHDPADGIFSVSTVSGRLWPAGSRGAIAERCE